MATTRDRGRSTMVKLNWAYDTATDAAYQHGGWVHAAWRDLVYPYWDHAHHAAWMLSKT